MTGFRPAKYVPAIIVFMALLHFGCSEPIVLEYDDLLAPAIEETRKEGNLFLKITGHGGHSALAVDRTSSEIKNDGLHVYVYLILVSGGRRSGALDYEMKIPNGVTRVFFGKKNRLIWERKR